MNKISFEQISETEIEVNIPSETPLEMVEKMTKGLKSKGLYEDLKSSTLSTRFFYRPENKAVDLADKLIKSLSSLAKDDELPYWHPKAQFANQKRVRDMEIGERRAKLGIKQPTNVSPAPEPLTVPAAPSVQAGVPSPSPAPKMYDTTPAAMNTADGTGRRYATIKDPTTKSEHVKGCQCNACLEADEIEKSGYGPKRGGQYSVADNIRRKANNTGDKTGFGSNTNTKAYTTAKFSGKDMQSTAAQRKPGPVKQFNAEEIASMNEARKLKKSEWGQHLPFPSAEEEIMNFAKGHQPNGEETAANQLAALMSGKKMLGEKVHPAVATMMAPPPPQPTNEQMFGGGVVTEDMEKAANNKWNNTFQDFMTQAQQPIAQRFRSEEEELVYWANIKVSDRDDGQSGY